MRAGLFGGTFNPIHNGHLMVAQQALDRLALDRLYVIPCWTPPHKQPVYLAPATDRVRMVRLALPGDTRLHLSEIEIQRKGPSYTIDTVDAFRTRITPDADLFLVMGMDAFLDIHSWKHYRQLLDVVQPVVVTRLVDGDTGNMDQIEKMTAHIHRRLSAGYRFDDGGNRWRAPDGPAIHLLAIRPVAVSSTMVRRRILNGKPVTGLVPPAVGAYIEKKGLYR